MVTPGGSPRSPRVLEHPLFCGSVPGSPSSASNATSSWRFTASWLTTTAVPPRQHPCDAGQAPHRTLSHRPYWLDARRVID